MRIEDTDPARHAGIEYPMEVSAPVFAPIKVVEEKDKAVNVARQNAKLIINPVLGLVLASSIAAVLINILSAALDAR